MGEKFILNTDLLIRVDRTEAIKDQYNENYVKFGYIKENVDELQLRVSNNQSDLEKINIKESPYVISRRINALQRLFEKNILKDWPDRAL